MSQQGHHNDPLYRKELLWLLRDRSAIVQIILIPLTVAGFQVFNMRGLIAMAQGQWNYIAGLATIMGTYFLWVLGPKSLVSEGPALWISLTWPRGLENLMKVKARLWSAVSNVLVSTILLYAMILFPDDIWKILLVGVGWIAFGRSMAEKAVTLVTTHSSAGEPEPVPVARTLAASLGMLTFSGGVLSGQWHIAIMGIVYSWLTAAAMWQNFRARIPFLFDPWSELLPPAPTVMHAMIALSALVEGTGVLTALFGALVGKEFLGLIIATSYIICSVLVCGVMMIFLHKRGVAPEKIWVRSKCATLKP